MQALESLHSEITAAGGQIFVVTSESQGMADQAKQKWKLPSLELIGDPSLSLARHLKTSGLLDVFISMPDPATEPWTAGHPYMKYYTNGCAQPSTLVISSEKDVWFAHSVIPHRTNAGGAVDRPDLSDVWRLVKQNHLNGGASIPIHASATTIRKQTLFDVFNLRKAAVASFGLIVVLWLVRRISNRQAKLRGVGFK